MFEINYKNDNSLRRSKPIPKPNIPRSEEKLKVSMLGPLFDLF